MTKRARKSSMKRAKFAGYVSTHITEGLAGAGGNGGYGGLASTSGNTYSHSTHTHTIQQVYKTNKALLWLTGILALIAGIIIGVNL